MSLVDLANFFQLNVAGFVLVFFRVSGLMLFAPLFGSSRVPRRVKILLALVMAMGMTQIDKQNMTLPGDTWSLTIAIVGELCFGIAMGMMVSLVFISAQWAGEVIGQQLGFNISEVIDPQFGQAGSLVGDLYFYLTMAIFLSIGGHRVLVDSVHTSLQVVPPLSLWVNPDVFGMLVSLMLAATTLAVRIAAPMFLTMLVLDVAMGFLSKTMPQFNIMTAGMSVRAMLGMVVLIVGIYVAGFVLQSALIESLAGVQHVWQTGVGR
jgi:flagellar biosynthesis protein FliR